MYALIFVELGRLACFRARGLESEYIDCDA